MHSGVRQNLAVTTPPTPGSNRTFAVPFPLDLGLTLAPLRHGAGDPTIRFAPDGVWRATRTARGAATTRLVLDRGSL